MTLIEILKGVALFGAAFITLTAAAYYRTKKRLEEYEDYDPEYCPDCSPNCPCKHYLSSQMPSVPQNPPCDEE